uniref:Protein LONGIFOLIA 2 n=1 Tax=Noccaea caerulescens TaxID=107243 RepID=A0A1J3K1C8_NOCCA
MAAKLLHTLADDNSDLQTKIGCMNGIFQIFDRHHVLTSRRKSLTLGNVNSSNFEGQRSTFQSQDSNLISGNVSSVKLTRVSTESSRVSFSSSCSSSSPLYSEVNKEAPPEISASDRVIFPESPTSDPVMSQGSGFATHLGLDLRDVVRDSMYREAKGHNRREDSPRPYGMMQSTPVDFNESCKALAKLRKTSQHYYNEVDKKDASRYYVGSRDKSKSGNKVKELPRLSLDSRDHVHLKSGTKLSESSSRSSSMNKVSGTPKRPPSVVAKLMGLETLPGSPLRRDKINMFDDNSDQFSRSLRENSFNRTIRLSPSSPRSFGKDPASSSSPSSSPRWRSSEFVMKPLSSLRYPIEPAPWKQTDRNRFSQKQASRPVKALSQSMEGRLKDVEFKHSGIDLRAFKEILEAMQSKGVFDTPQKQQLQCSNLEPQRDYKMGDSATCNQDSRGLQNQVTRGPIVIMKPARLVEKSGIPSSSLIPIHSLSGLNTTCREETVTVQRKVAKGPSSGNQRADSGISSVDNKSSSRNVRSSQVSKESTFKNSGSASSRLHQMKKHENDKRSPPSKSTRQTNRQPQESTTSPGGKRGPRAPRSLQKNDDQLRQMRNKSRTETEATVTIDQASEAGGGKSPSVIEAAKTVVSNLMQDKSIPKFNEDGSPEHPSPVSVLNASIYREINPSPVKMKATEGSGNGLVDSGDEHCEEDQWNAAYSFSETTTSFSPEINRKKLQNVEHLVQKLKRLNSSHDEASQDYIASLCENNDPNTDHRYISEILLASGLLLRDLGSELTTFQLHASGHPINPELFLVLEQTKGSSSSNEKLNRKLVFDAVNEMLVKKLAFVEGSADPWMKSAKAMKRVLSAQQLLQELCSEIETLQNQAKKRSDNFLLLEEQEEDFLKCILDEDMAIQSGKWIDFDDVIPGLVLSLERLLFKDLVSEIVHGEIGRLQANSGR